jgi:hypothetical protein
MPSPVLPAILLTLMLAAPAAAETDAPMAPVLRLVDAINRGAASPPAGVFTDDCVVLDDFAPYRWSGRTNGFGWYAALLGATPGDRSAFLALHGTLLVGAPQFSRITGETAYFVLPGVFSFNTDPQTRVRQTSSWIITERLVAGHWLISGHAWGITGESPALHEHP